MTFILNVLHKDMSILAADSMAIAEQRVKTTPDMTAHTVEGCRVNDYKKITLSSGKSLALSIAGHTQDHYYTQTIKHSDGIDDWLLTIRKHMDKFLRIHDRTSLSTLTSFTVNQGIASFFDPQLQMYFSNTFLFSPVENQTRLYRGKDDVQLFCAGTGRQHFDKAKLNGLIDIESLGVSIQNSRTPEACIPWIQDVYRKVSASDANSGAEPVFAASTRPDPKFRFL